jgi:hypothetical protein
MKTRTGFISNSSSTSFCVFGIAIENEKVMSLLEDIVGKEECDVESFFGDFELDAHSGLDNYPDHYIIGTDVDYLSENIPLREQRKNIANKINSIFGHIVEVEEIGFIVEVGYDG